LKNTSNEAGLHRRFETIGSIPLDHKIKSAVAAWREKGYERASPVTQRLVEFWFQEEHWLNDGVWASSMMPFKFWRAQG
jgi:hypothetical protein